MMALAHRPGRSFAIPLLVAAFAGLAMVEGLLIAAGAWPYAGVLIALLIMPLVPIIGFSGVQDLNGRLLLGGWVLMLLAPAFQQRGVPIGYLQEAVLGLLAIAVIRAGLVYARQDRDLRIVMLLFAAFMLAGILSTVLGHRSGTLAAVWQIIYNLKFPLMFLTGMLVVSNTGSKVTIDRIVRWSWVPMLAFVVLEIAAPGAHQAIMGPRVDWHGNPLLHFGYRWRGLAQHPGGLAIFCALLGSCAAANWLTGGRRSQWLAVLGTYGVLALLSGERQEAAGFVLALIAIGAIRLRRYWPVVTCVLLVTVALGVTWAGLGEHGARFTLLDEWGFGDPLVALSERGVLYKGGFDVAARYFPLGSGFGTYGGVGAQKFDISLSADLGFSRYWWFRQRLFLVDTYWPSVVAESGIAGFVSLLLFFGWMMMVLLKRAASTQGTPANPLVLYAVAALVLMLANSPSSIQLTDPRSAWIFWLLIGAAWRASMPPKIAAPKHAPRA